eukprot:CAMPEP_0114111388 /NCGR_PEP_ID=MMETSP0043_2-20121206/1828_1 /TAXON_ID=464988 /ORGANISM="Hemiselmis andersenii, Strain CCMP644" /LENGTH=351 /DNA_ID=CAMNT_0001203419 /DNA_START=10 /DNA_END=1061 /DNA_ORIENTATION=-
MRAQVGRPPEGGATVCSNKTPRADPLGVGPGGWRAQCLPPLLLAGGGSLPLDGVGLLRCVLILLPDLDRLVGLTGDEPRARDVKGGGVDASLTLQGPRLHLRLLRLKVVPRAPVEELDRPVVIASHKHVVPVDCYAVDNRLVRLDVLHEDAVWALPLLDVVARSSREQVLSGVHAYPPHALLVVRQRAVRLARREVPQPHRRVLRTRDDLRVGRLARHAPNSVLVPRQAVDLVLGPDVPHAHRRVPPPGAQHVEGGVQGAAVDARQVPMVVADDTVGLEIPALHELVLTHAEHVRVPVAHRQPADGADVPREGELQLPRGQVPQLDGPVPRPRCEPLVGRVHGATPHPSKV